ncbi:fungal-specific transcription factor domain-containing protein [Dactylonectria estremocensis]|uniref:Fungal-specific transcription factor domain-containing protein n=1 Tax=Dactylonectria estremocensis TaxID=1079267 RepID=A0A9P9JG62_9HYPO|nr:fungal-specific transcription factor domain-containing protein [Dactylonectria estremocensis]
MPRPVSAESTLAQKPCSNCRNRKIACDRALPTCTTCTRRKKVCSGYAINLSWPRAGDTRRATVANVTRFTSTGRVAFLNTSTWDVSLYLNATDAATRLDVLRTPSPRPSLRTPRFGTRTTPTEQSTVKQSATSQGDLRQDICSLLYRMSLDDETSPSLAVRHSMNALTYLHLKDFPSSIQYRMLAISALRRTISQTLDVKTRPQAVAASMLLSIYEVADRSGTTRDWSTYFDGCLMIFASGHQAQLKHPGDASTLLDWVLYYNVFYKFGIAHWPRRTKQQEAIANRQNLISQIASHPRRQIIQTTLGCSLEILSILSQAVDLFRHRKRSEPPSTELLQAVDELQLQLGAVDQHLNSGADNEVKGNTASNKHYTPLSRLFQLAVHIYLDRVVCASPVSSPLSQAAAEEMFDILRDLRVCERPFPMFILSLQAEEESERLLVLEALRNSKSKRALGNSNLTQKMIQRIWAQQDLHCDEGVDALLVINAVFGTYSTPPCLA